jgi:hypothetical protein
MLAQGAEHNVTNALRQDILGSNLDHARTCCMCEREQVAEIEIVREDNKSILPSQAKISRSLAFGFPTSDQCTASIPLCSKASRQRR